MTLDLRDHSAARIGSIWAQEDHQFLLRSLERIDQTCVDVWAKIRKEVRDAPKCLNEIVSLAEAKGCVDTETLDLPFDACEPSEDESNDISC